jgi:hypothetical protein
VRCVNVADTTIDLQVQLINTGNIILQDVTVALSDVSSLACKSGLATDTDTAVTSSSATFTPGTDEVNPGSKVVCTGSFLFNQAALDVNRASMTFTPSVTTAAPTPVASAASTDSYAGTATVQISAAPALVVTVDAAACVKPSIIPSGSSSMLLATWLLSYLAMAFMMQASMPIQSMLEQPHEQ